MSTIESVTGSLASIEPHYVCSDAIAEQMSDINRYLIVGPFCVGKSTLMTEVQAQSPDFVRVKGFTTRPQRLNEVEDAYDFLPHDEPTLQSLLDQVNRREVAQYAISPHTGYAYGSLPEAYSKPNVLLGIMAAAVDNSSEKLTFKKTQVVYLATPPQILHPRIRQRTGEVGIVDIRERLREGIDSVEWALDQDPADITWLVNDRPIDKVAEWFLHETVEGVSQTSGPRYARSMLAELHDMKNAFTTRYPSAK